MPHVGKSYPLNFYRDYSAPAAGVSKRLPWQWKFIAGIMRPGPFSDWAGKTKISDEPMFLDATRTIAWNIQAPSGADPNNTMRIEYRLNNLATFFEGRTFYLMSGVVAQEWSAGPINVTLDTWAQSQLLHAYTPPWPGGVPILGTPGNFTAATWSDLGVNDYPGFPFT